MAISVDWPASVIFVPKADTVLTGTDPVSGRELRTYDTQTLHEQLRDEGDSEAGRAFAGGGLNTHTYQTNELGNVTYAPSLFILSPYRLEFEDGAYQVKLQGTNNNIDSVAVVNQVQIVPDNSAGLQVVSIGSGLSVAEQAMLAELWRMRGLDASNPVTITPTQETSGDITIDVGGDGETSSTLTRL